MPKVGRRKLAAMQSAQEKTRGPKLPQADSSSAPAVRPDASRRRSLLLSLGLIALTLLVYAQVRHFDFVSFDDPDYVTENANVKAGLSWQGFVWAFTTGHAANWHPLTWLTHMLDAQIFGLNAGPQHVVNVVFHIASTLLLFAALQRMTGFPGRSAFVAALFAVHPAHVESVAWIAERKDVLSTFFLMLTLNAYAIYVRKPSPGWRFTVMGLFALGLMSKPMLVTLPFVLILLDVWPLQRLSLPHPGSSKADKEHRLTWSAALYEKLPLFALSAASSIVTFVVQRRAGAVSGLDQLPLAIRFENALVSYVRYIGEMLWPTRLAAIYPYVAAKPAWWGIASILILAAVSWFAVRAALKRPYVLVGWLWYLGTLVPVIGIVQVGIQPIADRYTYVPFIGLFIIVAWGTSDLLKHWRPRRAVIPALACVTVAACAITARAQVQHWASGFSLWNHAINVTEANAHALSPLADLLREQGRIDEAVAMYSEALRIEPNFAEAHNKLGVALADQGKTREAIAQYNEAIRLKPHLPEPHSNLGNALVKLGDLNGATAQYLEAMRVRPDYADAYNGLGSLLADQNKPAEAMARYREAIRLKPDFAEAHNNLGTALAGAGQIDQAIGEFREAVRLKPEQVDFRFNVAVMLDKAGRTADAIQELESAVKIKPDNPNLRQALALLKGRRP